MLRKDCTSGMKKSFPYILFYLSTMGHTCDVTKSGKPNLCVCVMNLRRNNFINFVLQRRRRGSEEWTERLWRVVEGCQGRIIWTERLWRVVEGCQGRIINIIMIKISHIKSRLHPNYLLNICFSYNIIRLGEVKV